MNTKLFILTFLAIICFINNLFTNFDVLQDMVEDTDLNVVLIDKGTSGKQSSYPKLIFRYLVYYVFFYDISTPLTIFELITVGG